VQEESRESEVEQDHVEIESTAFAPDPIFAQILAAAPSPPADSLNLEEGDAKPFVPTTPVNRTSIRLDSEQGDAKPFVPTTPVRQTAARNTDLSPYPRSDSPLPVSGTSKTVRTKLCHPVRFDYEDPTHDGTNPCHFCARAAYGVIGLKEKMVEIIDWEDGSGWEEVRGGHRAEGQNPTQICPDCTMARMRIMVCDGHALRRISGIDHEEERDLGEALNRLVEIDAKNGGHDGDHDENKDENKDNDAVRDIWCGVCCNLASFECCLGQQVEEREGCGLTLCELCVVDLGKCGGSLEKLLQKLGDEQQTDKPLPGRVLGLRADSGLLKDDDLLMGYLRSSA
jgi:hypothetical protein